MEDTIVINGIEYVRRDSANISAATLDGMPYCIVRCVSAGVFAGYIASRDGEEAVIHQCRRLQWYWSGVASLSHLAMNGVSRPDDCKFSVSVPEMTVRGVIEIIPATEKARRDIADVPEYKS